MQLLCYSFFSNSGGDGFHKMSWTDTLRFGQNFREKRNFSIQLVVNSSKRFDVPHLTAAAITAFAYFLQKKPKIRIVFS